MKKLNVIVVVLLAIGICFLSYTCTKGLLDIADSYIVKPKETFTETSKDESKDKNTKQAKDVNTPVDKSDKTAFQGDTEELQAKPYITDEVPNLLESLNEQSPVSVSQTYDETVHAMMRVYECDTCIIKAFEITGEIYEVHTDNETVKELGYILKEKGDEGKYAIYEKQRL